jgi:hypothetical protein
MIVAFYCLIKTRIDFYCESYQRFILRNDKMTPDLLVKDLYLTIRCSFSDVKIFKKALN